MSRLRRIVFANVCGTSVCHSRERDTCGPRRSSRRHENVSSHFGQFVPEFFV